MPMFELEFEFEFETLLLEGPVFVGVDKGEKRARDCQFGVEDWVVDCCCCCCCADDVVEMDDWDREWGGTFTGVDVPLRYESPDMERKGPGWE